MRHAKPIQPKLRLRDRRRRMMWVKVAAGTTVLAVCLGAVFYVSRLPDFQIKEIKVQGANIVTAEDVQNIVNEKLAGNYGVLIPRSNAIFAPKDEIEKALRSSFPEVARVTISGVGLTGLSVNIEERKTEAAWCAGAVTGAGDCYALDGDGFIFMKLASATGYVRYYGSVDGGPVGATYLSGDFKTLDSFVKDTTGSINRAADSVSVAVNNDVTLAFTGGGELRFVKTDDTQATLENVASVFASQSFKTKKDFEYADFRYGNKVYVKFKGE